MHDANNRSTWHASSIAVPDRWRFHAAQSARTRLGVHCPTTRVVLCEQFRELGLHVNKVRRTTGASLQVESTRTVQVVFRDLALRVALRTSCTGRRAGARTGVSPHARWGGLSRHVGTSVLKGSASGAVVRLGSTAPARTVRRSPRTSVAQLAHVKSRKQPSVRAFQRVSHVGNVSSTGWS